MRTKLRKKIIVGEIFFTFYTHPKKKKKALLIYVCVYIHSRGSDRLARERERTREKEKGREKEERRAEEEAEAG